MKTAQYTCPVSKKKARDTEAEDIELDIVAEDDDPVDLPEGWGRLTLDVAIPNPEVAKVEAQRAAERTRGIDDLKKLAADTKAPKHFREQAQAQLDDTTRIDETLAAQYPLPDAVTVWRRISFPVLSDETITALSAALDQLGFPKVTE